MTPEEVFDEAIDKAINYPGDRLRLTGRELMEFADFIHHRAITQFVNSIPHELLLTGKHLEEYSKGLRYLGEPSTTKKRR